MQEANVHDKGYVVLLHGISRGSYVMDKLALYLMQQGYDVYNDNYQSTIYNIDTLVKRIYARIQKACPDQARPIYFIGYSMGALIVRLILKEYRPPHLKRVVMIAPPNRGSEVAEFLKRFKFYQKWYGPAGQQIGTCKDSIVHDLPPVDFELGVIAGNRTVDPWFSWFVLTGENDGKVTVASTKIEGMQDHIVLRASHFFLPKNKQTILQVAHFLKYGHFKHDQKTLGDSSKR